MSKADLNNLGQLKTKEFITTDMNSFGIEYLQSSGSNHEMTGFTTDFESALHNYWQYYRELEDNFLQTQKFVSFNERNFHTFSIEFLKLFQAACSEVETLAKALALLTDPNFDQQNANIKKWWFAIQDAYKYYAKMSDCYSSPDSGSSLATARVCFMERLEIEPWMGLRYVASPDKRGRNQLKLAQNGRSLFWWKEHNEVKHQRMDASINIQDDNYSKANLKNVVYSFGALYILEIVLLQHVGTKNDLEAFMNDGRLFQPRPRFVASADIDSMFADFD